MWTTINQMKDVNEGGETGGVTITRQTAFQLSVVCLVVSAAVWLSARLENISVRIEQLEKRGSEPMQQILRTVTEMQGQILLIKVRLDEHMSSKPNGGNP